MPAKAGAGVIPFAHADGTSWFLFHKTFTGRRAGLLVDFGGGSRRGESQVETAAREFIEETDAMFFAKNCDDDLASLFHSQYALMLQLIEQTQQNHPNWWSSRPGRNWKTFFVEVKYRELADINSAWAQDRTGRFRKRRELLWLKAERLLDIINDQPGDLWKRLRQYQGMRETIQAIVKAGSVSAR